MVQAQYRVVPFMGRISAKGSTQEVAFQLQTAINQGVGDGWLFHSYCDVEIEVQPGCLGGLFGAKPTYVKYGQIVFVREY